MIRATIWTGGIIVALLLIGCSGDSNDNAANFDSSGTNQGDTNAGTKPADPSTDNSQNAKTQPPSNTDTSNDTAANNTPPSNDNQSEPTTEPDQGIANSPPSDTNTPKPNEGRQAGETLADNRPVGNDAPIGSNARPGNNRNPKPEPEANTSTVKTFPITEATGSVGTNVGDTVPEISGKDIEGIAFKSSDYAGKVMMIDFWGDW